MFDKVFPSAPKEMIDYLMTAYLKFRGMGRSVPNARLSAMIAASRAGWIYKGGRWQYLPRKKAS